MLRVARYLPTPVKIVPGGNSRAPHDYQSLLANFHADARGSPRCSPAPQHYQSLVKKDDVADRVSLRGFVSETEMIELYANALGICYLPFDEDYGYVPLEGMLS